MGRPGVAPHVPGLIEERWKALMAGSAVTARSPNNPTCPEETGYRLPR